MEELLKNFPVVVTLPVVWGEMDAMQHVNNAVYFRYFESARTAYFEKLGVWRLTRQSGLGVILASINCRFRIPLTYPDAVSVGVRAIRLEADRFIIEHCVVSHKHQKIAAEGEGLMICYDYQEQKKTLMSETMKQEIENLEASVAP